LLDFGDQMGTGMTNVATIQVQIHEIAETLKLRMIRLSYLGLLCPKEEDKGRQEKDENFQNHGCDQEKCNHNVSSCSSKLIFLHEARYEEYVLLPPRLLPRYGFFSRFTEVRARLLLTTPRRRPTWLTFQM
jgi:hypothetical protein